VPTVVSLTGHPKSFVLAGTVPGGRYIVEGSNDGGTSWDILVDDDGTQTFFQSRNEGTKTVDAIVEQVRVRSVRNPANATVPSITMGAPSALGTNFFGSLHVPTAQGLGDPLDIGFRVGPLKTFTARGQIPAGARFSILASMDGVQFDEVIQFTGDQQGARSREVMCRYLRVLRGGPLGPAPIIAVGGESTMEMSGGGGSASIELSIGSDGEYETTGSSEELFAEYAVPLAALNAATLTLDFSGIASVPPDASAAIRVRMGGTVGSPDGAQLVSIAAVGNGSALSGQSALFARPVAGTTLIKITGQGNSATLRGFTLLFHGA
jgi:hypothetical protein